MARWISISGKAEDGRINSNLRSEKAFIAQINSSRTMTRLKMPIDHGSTVPNTRVEKTIRKSRPKMIALSRHCPSEL